MFAMEKAAYIAAKIAVLSLTFARALLTLEGRLNSARYSLPCVLTEAQFSVIHCLDKGQSRWQWNRVYLS